MRLKSSRNGENFATQSAPTTHETRETLGTRQLNDDCGPLPGTHWWLADADGTPYAAWQRGSNENANGLPRRYLPHKLDFATVTDERLRWIEDRLNTRPRKTLAFRTPLAIFTRETRTVANRS